MPRIIDRRLLPNTTKVEEHYDYDYPNGLDLDPHNETHQNLLTKLMAYAVESHEKLSERFSSWNKIDANLTAYIPADLKDTDGKYTSKTPIIIPMSYATSETILTYLMTAFIKDPIFGFRGSGPEDDPGAAVLERVIQHNCRRFKAGLALNTMWKDSIAYGIGAATTVWDTIKGYKDGDYGVIYEGNKLINISPYMYLPDPNVEATNIQDGEIWGWIDRTNVVSILEAEEFDEDMFNGQYVKHIDGSSTLVDTTDEGNKKFEVNTTSIVKPVYNINLYVNLIPSDWGLGDRKYPEKWFFRISGDSIIITAKPLGLSHNMYPGAACAPDSDGYSSAPISQLEIVYGLQTTMDFLFSSHVANVRKAINDMLIVDPSLVNLNDLRNPTPGKLVRLRRMAWGRGVTNAVQQLNVNDITRNNIGDSSFIIDILQRVTGSSEILQGVMRSGGERRSATEARDAKTGALSRIEKLAKIIDMQAMQDIQYLFASHTQELMEKDMTVKLTGRFMEDLIAEYGAENIKTDRVRISPDDLNVDYDIVGHTGATAGEENPDLWVQLFQVLASSPELSQEMDIIRVFKHVARQLGAKNVEDFVRRGGSFQPVIAADSQVQQGVQRGDIVRA
jgi:hypothetical protein